MSDNATMRFMGLTKTQFLGLLTSLLAAVLITVVYLVIHTRGLAQEGAQSHKALCVLKADYARRVDDSRIFLKLTVPERVEKYGDGLGHTPPAVIRSSLKGLVSNLKALSDLECSS